MKSTNDLEKFIQLYKSVGIDLSQKKNSEGNIYLTLGYNEDDPMENTSNKFGGYSGFYSIIIFDENGKFIKQEFFE